MRSQHEDRAKRNPRRRQRHVQVPSNGERLAKRAEREDPIVQKHDQRCDRDEFLRQHAAQTGDRGNHVPARPVGRVERALRRKQGRDQEQPAERVRSLGRVVHDLAHHRMDGPHERRQQRDHGRVDVRPCIRSICRQCPVDDGEQETGREQVQPEIHQVVAPHVQAVQGVIQRKGEVHERPRRHRRLGRRQQWRPQRPERSNGWIVDDRVAVVPDERVIETVQVGYDDHDAEQTRSTPSRFWVSCRPVSNPAAELDAVFLTSASRLLADHQFDSSILRAAFVIIDDDLYPTEGRPRASRIYNAAETSHDQNPGGGSWGGWRCVAAAGANAHHSFPAYYFEDQSGDDRRNGR